MKKKYIEPVQQVIKIQQSQMLCASPLSLDDTDINMMTDDSKLITDENDIW